MNVASAGASRIRNDESRNKVFATPKARTCIDRHDGQSCECNVYTAIGKCASGKCTKVRRQCRFRAADQRRQSVRRDLSQGCDICAGASSPDSDPSLLNSLTTHFLTCDSTVNMPVACSGDATKLKHQHPLVTFPITDERAANLLT